MNLPRLVHQQQLPPRGLRHTLDLIRAALHNAAPGSEQQRQLAEARRTIVELIWHQTAEQHRAG